jgi:acyl-CoA thioesterase I
MTNDDKYYGVAILLCLLLVFSGCEEQSKPATQTSAETERTADLKTIVAVGDSLTEGYGVAEENAYPARLERRLKAAGLPWRVINAGISGETSSGLLSRVDWTLSLKPDIAILVTGANDGLRGIDPALIESNIDRIVTRFKALGVTVILGGMQISPNLGTNYTAAIRVLYPRLAAKHDLLLIPFFLAGVAAEAHLNQADGIHPTAEGYRIVTDSVYPYVIRAIEQRVDKP